MWKCHLAKTDDDEVTDVDGIRVNAYTNLTVAVEATHLAMKLLDWYDEEITADSTVTEESSKKYPTSGMFSVGYRRSPLRRCRGRKSCFIASPRAPPWRLS